MTRCLLDTNTCIQLINGRSDAAARRFRACAPADIALCSVVKAELLYGTRHSERVEANLKLLNVFFAPFPSLTFDDRCAGEYGMIRAQLSAGGTPIGHNDLMMTAIARSHDATPITHNIREFNRVAGLRLSD